MKTYKCVNYHILNPEPFRFFIDAFDIELTEKDDQLDFMLFDQAQLTQEIITVTLKSKIGLIENLKCTVYCRFGNSNFFKLVPTSPFLVLPIKE